MNTIVAARTRPFKMGRPAPYQSSTGMIGGHLGQPRKCPAWFVAALAAGTTAEDMPVQEVASGVNECYCVTAGVKHS